VLLHFDTDRDMQIFLQQRRRALNDRDLMPPPDGIFMIWIVFVVPSASAGKGKKSGRYSMQIEGDVVVFRAKSGSDSVVEIKFTRHLVGIRLYRAGQGCAERQRGFRVCAGRSWRKPNERS
jgi:hypothetical protein